MYLRKKQPVVLLLDRLLPRLIILPFAYSEFRRWVMITSYNKRKNEPAYKHHHPFYHPLNMVPDENILSCDPKMLSSINKDFMNPNRDQSAKKNS